MKAANDQSRGGDENDGEGDFSDDQELAEAARSTCDRGTSCGHRRAQIDAAGLESRQCAEQQAG